MGRYQKRGQELIQGVMERGKEADTEWAHTRKGKGVNQVRIEYGKGLTSEG